MLEHVAITEKLMLRRLSTQPVALSQEMSREREAVLYSRIATRGRKVDAPESAQPKGRYATLGDAIAAFLRTRERTLQWLEKCEFDLRSHAVEHPAVGPATVYEFVLNHGRPRGAPRPPNSRRASARPYLGAALIATGWNSRS